MTTFMDIEYMDGHTRHFRIHHINISNKRVLHIIGEGYPGECERHFVPLDVVRSWSFRMVDERPREDPLPTMPMGIAMGPLKVGDMVQLDVSTGQVKKDGAPIFPRRAPAVIRNEQVKQDYDEQRRVVGEYEPGSRVVQNEYMGGVCSSCGRGFNTPGCLPSATNVAGPRVHIV